MIMVFSFMLHTFGAEGSFLEQFRYLQVLKFTAFVGGSHSGFLKYGTLF